MTVRPESRFRVAALASFAILTMAPSAALAIPVNPIDLTTLGSSGTFGDGAIWSQQITQPTGTGVYDPFLRLQGTGNQGFQQGFNTDASQVLDNKAGIWTHSIQLSDLQAVEVGGVQYYSFDLDINDPQGLQKSPISLDTFQLFTVAGNPAISSLSALQALGSLRYDMDASMDTSVFLDSALKPGSGTDDMNVLIPVTYFAGSQPADFLYLYSTFGETAGFEGNSYLAQGGFEEWRVNTATGGGPPEPPPPGAPEPSTLLHLGSASLLGLAALRLRRG